LIERDAQRGVFDESGANDFGKGRGQVGQSELAGRSLRRQSFGERFAERNAERPDVRRGKKNGFGSGERRGERRGGSGFACGKNAVGGEFYVVAGGVNVGRLESGVDHAIFMKEIERGKNCSEHAAGFVGRERAAGKKLAKIFVGEFGDDVEARRAVNDAAAEMKNAEQAGMRESRGGTPVVELKIGGCGIRGDEFDGGVEVRIAWSRRGGGGEEHGGIGRDAEKFAERETAVRDLV
jgi:hypothetical protein